MSNSSSRVGVVGLGPMGSGIARSLLAAGHTVAGYDIKPDRRQQLTQYGGTPASDLGELANCEALLTSLPSPEIWRRVVEDDLLPRVSDAPQVIIDVGTSHPGDAERIGQLLAVRGIDFLDAPVSGGPNGAATGALLTFVGGRPNAVDRWRYLLDAFSQRVTYCGPNGAGQTVKAINQLAIGLTNAALMEAVALGCASGIEPATLSEALGGDTSWRGEFKRVADTVARGDGELLPAKFGQLEQILRHADTVNLLLPITRALHTIGNSSQPRVPDGNRMSPSYWHELTVARRP